MMRLITGGNFGGDHLSGSKGALAPMRRSRSHLGSKTSPAMWWQLGARKARACLNDAAQIGKERVSSIRAIETVISIRPACDEANRVHSGQLVRRASPVKIVNSRTWQRPHRCLRPLQRPQSRRTSSQSHRSTAILGLSDFAFGK